MRNFFSLFIPQNAQQARTLGTIIGAAIALLIAAILGATIRPSGIQDPANQPSPTRTVPSPDYLTTGTEAATACTKNEGNPAGYCWYSGYKWPSTSICIDSSIPGHPLGAVANMFRTIDSRIKIWAYGVAGTCKAKGFPSNRRVTFYPFTAHDKYANPRTCGMMIPRNYGAYWGTAESTPMIKINVTGAKRTPCGTGSEWTEVFAHEFGHSFGLSHNQPRVSSIMRDGHLLDAYDKYYIRMIMFGDSKGRSIAPNLY